VTHDAETGTHAHPLHQRLLALLAQGCEALECKGLACESVDGLSHANRARLKAVNARAEVPVLVDGDITVVNSSDIVAYLDLRYPERPIHPAELKARVAARALERLADVRIDAILLACSIWVWAERRDQPPQILMHPTPTVVVQLLDLEPGGIEQDVRWVVSLRNRNDVGIDKRHLEVKQELAYAFRRSRSALPLLPSATIDACRLAMRAALSAAKMGPSACSR
jgi:hypothetical protein